MGRSALIAVIRHAGADPGESDAALLGRFAASADHPAFAELVRRYARLVWGRCHSSLPCEADADDAFQATFLALAKHARSVRDPNRLGPWLHAVAGRVCKNARRAAARRTAREGKAAVREATRPVADSAWEQAAAAVHEEVGKLPPSLREAFVICVLEGKAPTAAAEQLGLPWGTFSARLSRAKAKLLERLAARGVGAAVAVAALTDPTAPAGTIERAVGVVRGASESVLSLVRGAVPMSVPSGRLLLLAVSVLGGMGALLPGVAQDPPKATPPKPPEAKAKLDLHGDPLPDKAVLRLGTVQYRVPALAGVGFKKTGELVAVTWRLELHTFPADGGPKATVTHLLGKPSDGFTSAVAVSPDARFACAYLLDRSTFVVWDISGDKPTEHLTADGRLTGRVTFSSDGSRLVVQNEDRDDPQPLRLADLGTKKWASFPLPRGVFVERFQFTPDGKRLAVTFKETTQVFDTSSGELVLNAKIVGALLETSALSPDGKAVAALPGSWVFGGEKEVRLLSVPDGGELKGWTAPKVKARSIGFLPDGKTLWTLGGGKLREWDPAAGKWLRETDVPLDQSMVPGPVWSPDGKRFVAHNQGAIAIMDTKTWKPLNADALTAGPTDEMVGVTVSPDGKAIATDGYHLHLWDAATGKLLARVATTRGKGPMVAFLPESKSLIAVVDYDVVAEFDARTGEELRRFDTPKALARKVVFSELRLSDDGKTLTAFAGSTSSEWKSAMVRWEVKTGEVTGTAEEPEEDHMFFDRLDSPNREWFLQYGKVRPTDKSEKPLEVIPMDEAVHYGFSWSADSKRVALPRAMGKTREELLDPANGSMVVFDVPTKSQLVELGTGKVLRSAFSPDGKRLATMTRNKLIVWEIATGKAVFEADCDGGHITHRQSMAFTPDGKRLITGHETHALVWEVGGATGVK